MGGLEGSGEELSGEEGEVVADGKGFGFCVKMINGRHLHTSGGAAEGVVSTLYGGKLGIEITCASEDHSRYLNQFHF